MNLHSTTNELWRQRVEVPPSSRQILIRKVRFFSVSALPAAVRAEKRGQRADTMWQFRSQRRDLSPELGGDSSLPVGQGHWNTAALSPHRCVWQFPAATGQ